jgi:ribosomal protein L11 methyltransferase
MESQITSDSAVIDIGCGSGILSIAALKLGAAFALGVDVDEASVRASRENANSNDIRADKFEIGLGSVAEVVADRFRVSNAPLVLANILAPVIIRLLDSGLASLVSAGGAIILSGILVDQVEGVMAALEAHGLRLVEKRQAGDWVALLAR